MPLQTGDPNRKTLFLTQDIFVGKLRKELFPEGQKTLHFARLKCRPNGGPFSCICERKCAMSVLELTIQPSSRYHMWSKMSSRTSIVSKNRAKTREKKEAQEGHFVAHPHNKETHVNRSKAQLKIGNTTEPTQREVGNVAELDSRM